MKFFVMAKTVLRNLFSAPATRRYPAIRRPYYKNTRGSISIAVDQCIFCGMCSRKCPSAALTVVKAGKKWTINRLRCIACGYCVEVCPKQCLAMGNHYSASVQAKTEETFSHA
ncbi:MAG: 4Fe-4S dicluster domain-containing protein [Candidatus Omnitrophica bacterium]|nr:4Fe-4S dicluster domain-containing protein [Candidatus Omnitrophota bacterium]